MDFPLSVILYGTLILTACLGLIACLSPLLTLAYLWQLKEWRWDRLTEHLKREGWFKQLFGVIRPGIFMAELTGIFLIVIFHGYIDSMPMAGADDNIHFPASLGVLMIFLLCCSFLVIGLSIIQILSKKQRYPTWTTKAKAIVGAGLVLNFFMTLGSGIFLLPFLVLLQPFVITFSWLLFYPVDQFLKKRILNKAKILRAHYNLKAIGITGSVGKTTTKELIAHILSGQNPLVTPAHVNTEMGVAQWLMKVLPRTQDSKLKTQLLITEMGAYRKGEIKNLCDIVQPSIGVITYIGTQHLALFGSQAKLIEAKGELLQALPEDGHAFINADCEPCATMDRFAGCPVTKVGTTAKADLQAHSVQETPDGIRFAVGDEQFEVPIHGTHNVNNVLLAMGVGKECGMSNDEIKKKLATFQAPAKTFQVREENGIRLLDDTHNASEASFTAAIDWAKHQPEQTKILLTSGIIELGADEMNIHEELGRMAKDVFSEAIFTHPILARHFEKGFGKPVSVASKKTGCLPPGSLLVCIGRMSHQTMTRILPKSSDLPLPTTD
ncbi:MAG: UDP-N-acetylmuramoyl-tripeptide--D-alanyl-D-alanine ligase [Candidatus Peribacteria bacterium]|nr:UDP-N-acetylmuramoyl-tripeptide--D-alanyl-D-alanine ligase [Candidatus Peribacteria bacterium]